jgi:hypothetical protein
MYGDGLTDIVVFCRRLPRLVEHVQERLEVRGSEAYRHVATGIGGASWSAWRRFAANLGGLGRPNHPAGVTTAS